MKLSDLLTKEEKELPKHLAKQMMLMMKASGGRIPGFKEFMANRPITELQSSKFRV